ncbi:hypothetical protein GC173_12610 [bacterium]|nr:hypothetical protein [bacterium]
MSKAIGFLLCTLVAAFFVASAAAQGAGVVDFRTQTRQALLPGVDSGVYTFNTRRGQSTVITLEAEVGRPGVHTDLITSPDGVLRGEELQSLAAGENCPAAYGLETQPKADTTAALTGLLIERGHLLSWPPAGNHLIIRPEGNAQIVTPAAEPSTVRFDDGTSFTIRSLNGPLPLGPGECSVYTGTLFPQDFVAEPAWRGSILVRLRPAVEAPASSRWLSADPARRQFRVESAEPFANSTLKKGELGLVVDGSHGAWAQDAAAQHVALTIDFSLDHELAEARIVLPVGERIMRGGLVSASQPEEPLANALLLDASGTRLAAMSAPEFARRGIAPSATQIAELFVNEGYSEGVALTSTQPSVLTDSARRDSTRQQSIVRVRSALGFRIGREALTIPDVGGELKLVERTVIENLGSTIPFNGPSSLADRRTAFEGSLRHFWAAPWNPAKEECGVRVRFAAPCQVAMIEVVHAAAAGFSPQFSVKAYRIEGRLTSQDPWVTLATVRHDEPVNRDRLLIDGAPTLIEMRLVIDKPSFVTAGDIARIAELYIWTK